MQASRLEESMAGNYRSSTLAHMAAEAGASSFFRHLRDEGWPESSEDVSGVLADQFKKSVGDGGHTSFEVTGVCWQLYSSISECDFSEGEDFEEGDDFVEVLFSGLSDHGKSVSRLVAKFRKMPSFQDGASYSCFGVDCSDSVGGNATLSGEDHHIPVKFDCGGAASCTADKKEDGDDQATAYYPDVPFPEESACDEYEEFSGDDGEVAYISCDGRIYGEKSGYGGQDQWYGFLDFIESSGFDVVLETGDELNYNIGGRDDYDASMSGSALDGFWDSVSPRFIEIRPGAEVTVNAHTNTLGVIVIREGAVFDYSGTSTHEGLILIEPGGTLAFSSGTPQLYGGVVALQSVVEGGEIITGKLDITGNMGIRYSSFALDMLRKGGKGIRLMSWYTDFSQ
jgi:hypothetical protein